MKGDASGGRLSFGSVLFCGEIRKVRELYTSAFERSERMPFFLMLIMSLLWHTRFLSFYDNGQLCGLAYTASLFRKTFIMFLAVDEKLRGKGYGTEILGIIGRLYPKNAVIVSIEPCDGCGADDIRVRRKEFYRRSGYLETGYYMKLSGVVQEVLITNGTFSKARFMLFFMFYSNCTVFPKLWKQGESAKARS